MPVATVCLWVDGVVSLTMISATVLSRGHATQLIIRKRDVLSICSVAVSHFTTIRLFGTLFCRQMALVAYHED